MPAVVKNVERGAARRKPVPEHPLLHPLSADPWFGALELQTRHDMLACGELLYLRHGEFVFRQGDLGAGFYGLLSGGLRVSTLREDGREAVLAVLEAGNWFGEASALDGLPRTHDVAALGDVALHVIGQDEFQHLLRHHDFARAIALLQARHLRAVYAMLEDATLRSTRARIVRRLLRLAHGDATMAPVERRVVKVTQDTLAMMVGITRQTLALELKEMARHGAIRLGYGRIEIVSVASLEAMAEGQALASIGSRTR
jgi:CRP/FNR family transcriptional regulator, cyclic AMP receptor protein